MGCYFNDGLSDEDISAIAEGLCKTLYGEDYKERVAKAKLAGKPVNKDGTTIHVRVEHFAYVSETPSQIIKRLEGKIKAFGSLDDVRAFLAAYPAYSGILSVDPKSRRIREKDGRLEVPYAYWFEGEVQVRYEPITQQLGPSQGVLVIC